MMDKAAVRRVICERLAEGESLRAICRDEGMPSHVTVFRWIEADEYFRNQYARAKSWGCDVVADEIIEIADTPQIGRKVKIDDKGAEEVTEGDMIEHRRLRVDSRKWYLSKIAPKKYGERTVLAGDPDAPLETKVSLVGATPEQLRAIASLKLPTEGE